MGRVDYDIVLHSCTNKSSPPHPLIPAFVHILVTNYAELTSGSLREKERKNKNIDALLSRGDSLSGDLLHHQELHGDSDSEDEDDEDNEGIAEQRRLRRKFRNRKPKTVKGLFWSGKQSLIFR